MSIPEIPEKNPTRPTINRSYDIFVDQNEWLVNSPYNKSKIIRSLLDDFINGTNDVITQNLQNKIVKLVAENVELINNNIKLLEISESQKSVIIALGGKE